MKPTEFEDYQQDLTLWQDAFYSGGEAHARYMWGNPPIKPEGYYEWKKTQPLTELEQRAKEYEEKQEEKRK